MIDRTIDFSYDVASETLTVEGIKISAFVIPQIIFELTHPDPRRWYRIERIEDHLVVHVRMTEFAEEPHGNPIASIGSSKQDSGGKGQEAAHPGDAHPPYSQ
jgi:hypothetical protein